MAAFFSGTDDANENATQFYGVWGKVADEQPQFAFRYCSGEAKTKINPSVLFDWPTVRTTKTYLVESDVPGFVPQTYQEVEHQMYQGPFAQLDYPDDWMGQHTAKAITIKSSGTGKYPSRNGKGRSLLDAREEELAQLRWDMEESFRGTGGSLFSGDEALADERLPFGSGFEDAEIIQFINAKDELNKADIYDDIMDITADYTRLGYDQVIESAIHGIKQNFGK